jgi:general secretion pathway protein M
MNWRLLLQARWQAVSVREQRLLLAAAWLVGLALLWWLALAPALAVLRHADAQHQTQDAQLQQMLRLQAQAQALRALPTLDAQEARRALEQSVKVLGRAAQITPQMDRLSVSLKGVSAQALAQWLASARQNAHVLPTEAHLRRSAAGIWDGTVVFTLPAQ